MTNDEGKLTDQDHANMDTFLGHVLDDYKNGLLSKPTAVSTLAHVIAAIDINNHAEARNWFQQGRKFLTTLHGK